MGSPPYLPQEGMQVYSTPAHEGLQVVEQNPYTYQGQIQPDVVPLHILGAKYGDDNLLPAYPERRICGVRARIFWTIFGVAMFLIVVAAAVGGGIGGSQAAQHAKEAKEAGLASTIGSTSNNPASTSSLSSISATGSSSLASSTTPAVTSLPTKSSGSTPSSSSGTGLVGATPIPTSGILPLDCPTINGSVYTSPGSNSSFSVTCSANIEGDDVALTMAPSLDACMDDCASYLPAGDCMAIVFNANLTLSTPLDGNCFFKSGWSGLNVGSDSLSVSAVLQSKN
ncbi:hypothetical protein OIDMADRAFT_27198 [Oidiodendron maius Zn]|uniref:Apple domain-containing protein n=1 Tax=Oidiodendron maius (strain Zn) TaxID=913774 RepID=A0A0C3DL08_OIDMZ|nr:hypothetical protein OIDMADRAFT_27198 [Oidiodendron maius Zn]